MDMGLSRGLALWCGQGGLHTQPTQDQEAEITGFVTKCAEHGIRRLFPALIRPDYFPRFINFDEPAYRGPVFTLKDFYARWHPLKVLIEAAHEKGIEVHPYINVNSHGGRWPNWGSALNSSTVFGTPVRARLAIMATSKFASDNPQFRKRDRSLKDTFQVANNLRLSPAVEEVRAHEQEQLLQVIEEFSPDGVQLEFSQEPVDGNGVTIYGYEEPALQAYEQEYGHSPLKVDNSDPSWVRFRCRYVTTFVRELRARLGQLSRPIPLTAAIIASDPSDPECYQKVFRDWPAWVREGLIDALYLWFREFIDLNAVPQQTRQAAEFIDGRCPLIAELSTYHRGALKTPESLKEAARLARQAGADAVGVYRSDPIEALDLWSAVKEIGEAD